MMKQKLTLISYYSEGWHFGYLVRKGYKWPHIRRILPLGVQPTKRGMRRQFTTMATTDTREVTL